MLYAVPFRFGGTSYINDSFAVLNRKKAESIETLPSYHFRFSLTAN